MTSIQNIKKEKLFFLILLILFVANKVLILVQFSSVYTSSDDVIQWMGARDYAQGVFHEPYFYGQNYNFMLESLFAVPFVWLGIPYHWALPMSTIILASFPFILFARVLYKRRHYFAAYTFLVIPVLLSLEYDILTSLSRGFISGIFFCSFLIYPILEPQKTRSFIIFGAAASFGFIFNPNTLILTFPIGIYMLFTNFKTLKFYLLAGTSAIPALIIHFLSKSFYWNNPDFQLHEMWELLFKWRWIREAFNYLDLFFTGLTPVLWSANWFVLLILIIFGILLYRKNKIQAITLFSSVVFIILTLGINKVHDGIDWIFLSSTRMFLAIPLLLGLAIFWNIKSYRGKIKWLPHSLVVLGLLCLLVKGIHLSDKIGELNTQRVESFLAVTSIDELEDDCGNISTLVDQNNADIVVFIPHWDHPTSKMQLLNYGCSFVNENMESSVISIYERRTWKFREAKERKYPRILLYGYDLAKNDVVKNENIKVLQRNPDIILVANNQLSIPKLIAQFNFEFKRR